MSALIVLALLGAGFVAGSLYEGCRRGGTLDLRCQIALNETPIDLWPVPDREAHQ